MKSKKLKRKIEVSIERKMFKTGKDIINFLDIDEKDLEEYINIEDVEENYFNDILLNQIVKVANEEDKRYFVSVDNNYYELTIVKLK